jgi:hypothetical protein
MDDKGYAFTPLAVLLFIPVIILAVSFSGIVNEVNSLSAIVIGGDVTATVASNVVESIKEDTADAGRNSAFMATRTVIDNYNLNNNPFFGTSPTTDSRNFIESRTLLLVNQNMTNTCRELEKQTGRTIIINNVQIDPAGTDSVDIFQAANMNIVESDPFGFNITITAVPVRIIQNSTTNNQSFDFNTPPMNVYVSIEKLEDPYIWVNTYGRNSSVIFKDPYYTPPNSIIGGNASNSYHFADQVSAGKLQFLNQTLAGPNSTVIGYNTTFGPMPYYFPDTHGLSFFDRLENRTNNTSGSPASARMSTFILWNPNFENMPGYTPSYLDHEYFLGKNGTPITTKHSGVLTTVTDPTANPTGNIFYLTPEYKTILGLLDNYDF